MKPYPYTRINSDSVRYELLMRRMLRRRQDPDCAYFARIDKARISAYWMRLEQQA